METLAILFVLSLVVYLNLPKGNPPKKDPWCEMGKAIDKALQSLNKPPEQEKKSPKKNSPPMIPMLGFALGATLLGSSIGLGPLWQTWLPQRTGFNANTALFSTPSTTDPNRSNSPNQAQPRPWEGEPVVVIRESASIKVIPDEAGWLVYKAPFNTPLAINYEIFNRLPEAEQAALLQGNGWMPVLLPNGDRGFVNGSEARQIILPP